MTAMSVVLETESTNFDRILKNIADNANGYDEESQLKDIECICSLIGIKYNSSERVDIANALIDRLIKCLDKEQHWISPRTF